MIVKAKGKGLVNIGVMSPAVIINPERSFSSPNGAKTNPITKGPSGMRALSNKKPIKPNNNITHTSNIVLFKA